MKLDMNFKSETEEKKLFKLINSLNLQTQENNKILINLRDMTQLIRYLIVYFQILIQLALSDN